MPSMLVGDLELNVAANAAFDIRPPAGQAYCIRGVSSQHAFVGDIPDVQISMADGVHAICDVRIDPTTAVQKGRDLEIYITHDVYLTITNRGAINADIGWWGFRVNPARVASQIVTVPASARANIRPAAGQVLRITEFGAETMGAANHPDVNVFLTDGVLILAMLIGQAYDIRQNTKPNWYIDNSLYLSMLELSAADCDFAVSAWVEEVEFFGGINDIIVAALTTFDIQPADGEEAVITAFAAETWAALAPAVPPIGSPDVTFSLFDGVDLSTFIEAGSVTVTDSPLWNNEMHIMIDHDHYVRLTDVSGADNQVAYSGYIRRRYNP